MTNDGLLKLRKMTPSLTVLWSALGLLVLLFAPMGQALAQAKNSAEAAAQADEFNKQKGELLTRLKELKGKIDNAGSAINKKEKTPEEARQTIEEMRAVVSPLLAAVADNGDISQLGAKALKNAKDRKAALERDQRFSAEDRQKLVDAWERRVKATADAMAELEKARIKFLGLLLTLQSKEDLIGEWAAIKAQDEVIATIKQLTDALNDTSTDVQNFIAWLESPSS